MFVPPTDQLPANELPANAPAPATLTRSQALLDRRLSAAMLIITIGVLSFVAASMFWLSERAENDALERRGTLVSAQVIGVRTIGTDTLLVAFDYGANSFENTITANAGTTYDESDLGEYVDVLFDPANPDRIRLPGHRNMSLFTPMWAITSLAFIVMRALRLPNQSRAKHLAERGDWTLAFATSTQGKAAEALMIANTGSRRRKIAFQARADGRPLAAGQVIGGKQSNTVGELVWLATDGNLAIAIADKRKPIVVKLRR